MQNVEEQKVKLQQKKNRLAAEEVRFKLKERKMRTRNLIELGGLVVKAKLDHLPVNALYGALLSIEEDLKNNDTIKATWILKGNAAFNEEKQERTAVILKFDQQPSSDIRELIRSHSLMWNRFRSEWYGYMSDISSLEAELKKSNYKYDLQIIDNPTEV